MDVNQWMKSFQSQPFTNHENITGGIECKGYKNEVARKKSNFFR